MTALLLRNRHAIWALVVGIVILGVVAYQQIPVRLFPDTAPPVVNVVTAWPGATAGDVDRDLTEVLETELASLEGVARTSATSQDNLSVVQVEFHYGTDVRLAAVDVQNAVARAGEDLPAEAQQPRVLAFSTADRPVYTVGVVAGDLLEARRVAEDVVAPRLQAIDGVAAVDVFGGQVPTVLVDVDPALAEAHRVSLQQVAAAIRSRNVSAPAGRLRSEAGETMLRVDQRAARVADLEDLVLPVADGGQLRLGSLGEVRRGATDDDAWFGIDGQRAIAVQVYRSEDANTVEVVGEVRRAVAALEAELPDVTFVPGEESASFTEQSVSNLLGNVWQALLLASILLFLFLGRARAAAVTAFTMPLSFGLTFAVMWLAGIEFNMVTLSAVILAVGMVVDASVVVLENIVRLRDAGHAPLDAARQGADEVQLPVLAGVATTLVVLVPLLGLPGFVGKVFGPLASTLIIAFSSSVLVALVLVPILSLQIGEGGRLEAVAARVSRPFQAGMERLREGYLRLLEVGLRRRRWVLGIALLSFLFGVGGLRMAGMDLLPRMDGGTFTISLQTPSGSSLAQTTAVLEQIESLLAEQPEVVLVQSQAGFEPGMKFTGGSGAMGPTQGFVSVTLSPRTERSRSIWQIEEEVRQGIAALPGIANVVVKEVGNTAKPTTVAPIVARVSGPDPLVLDHLGDQVVATLGEVESVVQPTRAWRRDMRRVLVTVDEARAASLGQSALSVARQLASGAEGVEVGAWTPELASTEPILVRFARPDSPGVDELLSWPLVVPEAGEVVPIRAVASARTTVEQGLHTSEDLGPVLDVHAEVDGRPLSFVVADAAGALARLEVPEGYRVAIEGENEDLVESRSAILRALAVSVLAVYLLLVAQFRSWVHPLTVMMAVPLSLSGVSLALWLAGKPVSMPVMVGLVLLVGTVVNNSILLVDVIRQRREAGQDRREAIRHGVASRFRPIMMTSLSTIIGMLPLALELALGAERFSPLATAVIGGMLASTLLTLVVIPVLYDVADGLRLPRRGVRAAALGAGLLLALAGLPGEARAADLTLEGAWQLVLEHPSAAATDLQVEAARARARAATGRLLPQAELTARTTRMTPLEPAVVELPIQLPDGSAPDPIQLGESYDRQHTVGVTVTQPLFAGGAVWQGRKAAVAGVEATEARREGTRAELWVGLVQAWYGHAVARKVVEIEASVVDAARAREGSLEHLVARGRAVDLELSRVVLERVEAEQRLAEARRTEAGAAAALEALLGGPAPAGTEDVVAAARAQAVGPLPEGISAGVREAEALAEGAEARGRSASGALWPSVALRAGARYANPDMTQFPPRPEWGPSWDVSLVASWTLDAGVRFSEARAARLDAAAAREGHRARARQDEVDRDHALRAVALAADRLDLAAERVRVAERAVRAAETALSEGRLTAAELLQRQADLGRAQAAEQRVALDTLLAVQTARILAGSHGPGPTPGDLR